jgi:hypothetical protein
VILEISWRSARSIHYPENFAAMLHDILNEWAESAGSSERRSTRGIAHRRPSPPQ